MLRLIRRRCRGYWHHHGGDAVICCGYLVCEVSNLKVECRGRSPSACSRGCSEANPPEYHHPHEKRLNDANVVAEEADIRVLRIMVGWHDTEGFASLHPRLRATRSARAFDLSGRAAVWFLPRIFTDSVMVALPRIYAGDCARRKSRRCLLLCGLRIFANFAE